MRLETGFWSLVSGPLSAAKKAAEPYNEPFKKSSRKKDPLKSGPKSTLSFH